MRPRVAPPTMTQCTKTGIKIRESNNDYKVDPFAHVNPFQQSDARTPPTTTHTNFETLDLNLDHYSRADIYKLFGLSLQNALTEEHMKEAKKVVLKTHPDKSRLDNKYFIFFGNAFKKLYGFYEYQTKATHQPSPCQEKVDVVDVLEKKTAGPNPDQFNAWFNEQFEKNRLDDPIEHGYGKWLQSEEDIAFMPTTLKNKDAMASEMEKRKKEVQALTPYKGVQSLFGASSAGSSLIEYNGNFSSGSLFSSDGGIGYTDLRQAYVESVVPVTEEDYHKVPKYRSVDEYKRARDSVQQLAPMDSQQAMEQLFREKDGEDGESAAMAYYYAQQQQQRRRV